MDPIIRLVLFCLVSLGGAFLIVGLDDFLGTGLYEFPRWKRLAHNFAYALYGAAIAYVTTMGS